MRFSRYMTGRGEIGYGFTAATAEHPQASYMTVRMSDTGDLAVPVLEMMTTRYGEIGVLASYREHGREAGYTDILFPVPPDTRSGEDYAEQWREIMDNPGRLLYLPHVDEATFLKTSQIGQNVLIPAGSELYMDCPVPEPKEGPTFAIDDDMLACLTADVWYAASLRMNQSSMRLPVIHLQLTDDKEDPQTLLEVGRAFYNHVLMPALPQPIRRIISVSIGATYTDASNDQRGGTAALIIPQYDQNQMQDTPGRYILINGRHSYQPLDPIHSPEKWRDMGRALLYFARGGSREDAKGHDAWLNDFMAVGQHLPDELLPANWIYAFLLFNGHDKANEAQAQIGVYAPDQNAEAMQEAFGQDVWTAYTTELLTNGEAMSEEEARCCYVWLERDILRALLNNRCLLIDQERYDKLFRMAFSIPTLLKPAELAEELEDLYIKVLNRDRDVENGSVKMLVKNLGQEARLHLTVGQEKRLLSIVENALESRTYQPTDEELHVLAAYASASREAAEVVTRFAAYLAQSRDAADLACLRPVQYEQWLDDAILQRMNADIEKMSRKDETGGKLRASFKAYADTVPGKNAMAAEQMRQAYAAELCKCVEEHPQMYVGQMPGVLQAFADLSMDQTEDAKDALCACLEAKGQRLTEDDAVIVRSLLKPENANLAERLLETLQTRFENELNEMMAEALEADDRQGRRTTVISKPWIDCVTMADGKSDSFTRLRSRMSDTLYRDVDNNRTEMRGHMSVVLQAFGDIGMDGSDNMLRAICTCMEISGSDFTSDDARYVIRILRSGDRDLAEQMKHAVMDLFNDRLEEIVASDGETESPLLECVSGKEKSQAQNELQGELLQSLKAYADANAVELTDRVGRVMALYEKLQAASMDPDSVQLRLDSLCNMLSKRVAEQDEGALLTENDLQVLGSRAFRNMDDETAGKLAETLMQLFQKDLLRMFEDEGARQLWRDCLKDRNVGAALKKKTADAVGEYVSREADELYETSAIRIMRVYKDFDADGGQRLKGWCSLLKARAKHERGSQLLTKDYAEALTEDAEMLRAVDEGTAAFLADVFTEELPLLLEGQPNTCWADVLRRIRNVRGSFDDKAQQALREHMNRETEDHVEQLLHLVVDLKWYRYDISRDLVVSYMTRMERQRVTPTELELVLEIRANAQRFDLEALLSPIFVRNMAELLSNPETAAEAEKVWRKAVESGVGLKTAFRDAVHQYLTDREEAIPQGKNEIQPLITLGKHLGLTAEALDIVLVDILGKRNQPDGLLVSGEEHQLLLECIRQVNDKRLWCEYITLLSRVPEDKENEERNASMRDSMVKMRQSILPFLTPELAAEAMKQPVWRDQLQHMILSLLERLTAGSEDFRQLCELPARWLKEREALVFIEFTDLLTYISDKQKLQAACEAHARSVVEKADIQELSVFLRDGESGWFGELIGKLIRATVMTKASALAMACDTPKRASELAEMLRGTCCDNAALHALNYVLDEKRKSNAEQVLSEVCRMPEEEQHIVAGLLNFVLVGTSAKAWEGLWHATDSTVRIPLAAASCLTGDEPDWVCFLKIAMEGVRQDRNAIASGADAMQAAIFAARVLGGAGMCEQAEELPEQLSHVYGDLYSGLRGAGLKRQALAPMRESEAWGQLHAGKALYALLFEK